MYKHLHKDVEACRRLESTRTHRDYAVHSLHNLGITAKTNTSRFSTALAGNTNTSEETDVYLSDLGTFTKIKQNNNKQKNDLNSNTAFMYRWTNQLPTHNRRKQLTLVLIDVCNTTFSLYSLCDVCNIIYLFSYCLFYNLALALIAMISASVSRSYQHLNQWFGSCKSLNANFVMCCHACWMWRDSVARAQMASLSTKRLLSWQGTRWISRHLSILSSSFWFSSLEPWEESLTQPFQLTKDKCCIWLSGYHGN